MLESLPLYHRLTGTAVVVVGEGEAADAKRRLVERAGAVVCTDLPTGIAHGARLAFIVHEDAAKAEALVEQAHKAGLLVNATDRPALCDFTVPSILDRSPVLIAVGTGGASAGLAKHVRLRLEQILPASLGGLANALKSARAALRQRFPDAVERRRALDIALGAGGPLDPFNQDSAQRVEAWLNTAQLVTASRFEILLRSNDPEDLTLREARALGEADVVLHDPQVSVEILNRARADAVRSIVPEHLDDAQVEDVGASLTVIVRVDQRAEL